MNICRILLFFASFLIGLSCWSQERVLQVENRKSGEQIIIPPSTKVVLTTINNDYRGEMNIVGDSLIKVGNDLFLLGDIIALRTNNRNFKKTGITLIIFGAGGVGLGCIVYTLTTISNIVNAFGGYFLGTSSTVESYALAKAIIGAGGATFVTGTVLLLRKQVYPNSEFRYQLITNNTL